VRVWKNLSKVNQKNILVLEDKKNDKMFFKFLFEAKSLKRTTFEFARFVGSFPTKKSESLQSCFGYLVYARGRVEGGSKSCAYFLNFFSFTFTKQSLYKGSLFSDLPCKHQSPLPFDHQR
jgi:hypothetical protein